MMGSKNESLNLALALIDSGWTDRPMLLKLSKVTEEALEAALEARKSS
ncbi:MAG: hypothetical protein LBF22_13775 [Deltaproteobacteria bacterium]|jgi:hypothetical protein|nr:hypothetical protein [Deltaproteobacteria bacterium]